MSGDGAGGGAGHSAAGGLGRRLGAAVAGGAARQRCADGSRHRGAAAAGQPGRWHIVHRKGACMFAGACGRSVQTSRIVALPAGLHHLPSNWHLALTLTLRLAIRKSCPDCVLSILSDSRHVIVSWRPCIMALKHGAELVKSRTAGFFAVQGARADRGNEGHTRRFGSRNALKTACNSTQLRLVTTHVLTSSRVRSPASRWRPHAQVRPPAA